MRRSYIILPLLVMSCASSNHEQHLSSQEQVAEVQKMCMDNGPAIKARQQEHSLYERLGKREGIHNFFTHLLPAHRANKKISHIFTYSDDKKVIENSTEFLSMGSGGPGQYKGSSMKDVHKHLHITSADFMEAGEDVKVTMRKLGYGENEVQEVICALASFVPDVVVDI